MAVTVDQAKLVLNSFAAIFQNNLLSKDLVTWKKFDNEMNDRNALTVVEQVGPRYVTTQTVDGVADLSTGTQDSVFGSEQYKLNRTFNTNMGFSDFQRIRDIGSARESEALKNAAINMAEQIDKYILGYVQMASNNWTGTPDNSVATFADVASAYTRLKEEGVEDADLKAVLTYGDRQALGTDVIAKSGSLESIGSDAYRSGWGGAVAGIDTLFTQQLSALTFGTRTNGAVNGAAQNVNYKAVSVSPAPGQYLTQTIAVDGLGNAGTVKDGEVFTIANVFAYDNRAQKSLAPRLQQFRVIGDYTASAGGAIAAMRIFPAIIVPNTATAIGDNAVNTANATVNAAPADDAVVTWLGTAAATVTPRVIVNKQAVIINTADLIMPATGTASRKSLTKVPVSVRMWWDSTFATADHRVRFDVALAANITDRRRLVRINGS